MINNQPDDKTEGTDFYTTDETQPKDNHFTEDINEENEALKKAEKENTGMSMGTEYKEDTEQDLDELLHDQASLQKNQPPEDV